MNIPIVLHGHCHHCVASNLYYGTSRVTKILTAGAFKNLNAASFMLVRVDGQWEVASQTLMDAAVLSREEQGSL